jgi:hypothetical protein
MKVKTGKGKGLKLKIEDPLVRVSHLFIGDWCIINLLYINITYHNARQV